MAAAPGCVLHRALTRSRPVPTQASSSSPAVCREVLRVLDLQRYSRDQGASVYFPQAVLHGEDLYDVTVTDGDCRLRVTLDPGLNRQVERNNLRPGAALRNAAFSPTMTAGLPQSSAAGGGGDSSFRLVSVDVCGAEDDDGDEDDAATRLDANTNSLPWYGSSQPAGPLVPLRANRITFLPLWNNTDYSGEVWREAPPTEEDEEQEEEEEEEEALCPGVSVCELREAFQSGRRGVVGGVVTHQLIVRIINKSHLMYYGKTDRNCECPYKALLEVCDGTGSVCVVLWNSVCVSWYRAVKPGQIVRLSRYRVKQRYQVEQPDIEISVNSRNPTARISILPESSVSPEYLPPMPTYNFCSGKELLDRPHGNLCDVIGLVMFSGRPERVRTKGGQGAELSEYRWLQLEDGTSEQPVMVKLSSTSQPETHRKLHPLSVVVCTRLKLIRPAEQTDGCFYLINTTYTQVYCTGLGHHSEMPYRKLRPVRQFLQWLKSQDDGQVLSRALVGGFFIYPPPPVSLETFMKEKRGEPGFLRGAELQMELEQLCYRERRTFCIQATVTMVMYCLRGEEDRCLLWTDRAASLSPSSSSSLSHLSSRLSTAPSSPLRPPHSPSCCSSPRLSLSSAPRSPRSPLFSSSPCSLRLSPSSPAASQLTWSPGKSFKRKPPRRVERVRKRLPLLTLQPEQDNKTVVLFEASMEFLEKPNDEDEDEDEDDDASTFFTPPCFPAPLLVAAETLPLRYSHTHREEQAAAVAMGGQLTDGQFDSALQSYYTLKLRALSDGVLVDAVFLPRSAPSSSSLSHSNSWISILSHGAFSSHTPPPSPADLISMAAQLASQRLVCILEACHLGGAKTELILSRAFLLTD